MIEVLEFMKSTKRSIQLFIGVGLAILAIVGAQIVWAAFQHDEPTGFEVIPPAGASLSVENVNLSGLGQVEQGQSIQGSFDLVNAGSSPATGVVIAAVNADGGITATYSCTGGCGTVAANSSKTVTATFDVGAAVPVGFKLFTTRVTAP